MRFSRLSFALALVVLLPPAFGEVRKRLVDAFASWQTDSSSDTANLFVGLAIFLD